MQPLRAEEELRGGVIHKPMFDRLMVCKFALADLTTANANVFYELGVRHALRAITYRVSAAGTPDNVAETRPVITRFLNEARRAATDSLTFRHSETSETSPTHFTYRLVARMYLSRSRAQVGSCAKSNSLATHGTAGGTDPIQNAVVA